MYFKLIMLVVAIYVCGLTAFSFGMVLASKRKTWYLKVAQSFGIICFGVISNLFILWMPHCNRINACLGIIFIILPVLVCWSTLIFVPDVMGRVIMAFLQIKEACAAKNITLKDLSKLSGISERSLEWYVKQQREPSLSRVEKLAKVLEEIGRAHV